MKMRQMTDAAPAATPLRAAAPPTPALSGMSPIGMPGVLHSGMVPVPSLKEQLLELQELKREGLIDEEEYQMAKRSRLCGGTPPLMEQPSRARDARGASAIGRRASPSRSASSSRRLRYDERPEEGEPPAVAEQLESMLGSTDLSAVERTLHECAHGAMDSESEDLRRKLVQHRSVRSPVMLSGCSPTPSHLARALCRSSSASRSIREVLSGRCGRRPRWSARTSSCRTSCGASRRSCGR